MQNLICSPLVSESCWLRSRFCHLPGFNVWTRFSDLYIPSITIYAITACVVLHVKNNFSNIITYNYKITQNNNGYQLICTTEWWWHNQDTYVGKQCNWMRWWMNLSTPLMWTGSNDGRENFISTLNTVN